MMFRAIMAGRKMENYNLEQPYVSHQRAPKCRQIFGSKCSSENVIPVPYSEKVLYKIIGSHIH